MLEQSRFRKKRKRDTVLERALKVDKEEFGDDTDLVY